MRMLLSALMVLSLTVNSSEGLKATVAGSGSTDVLPTKMDIVMTFKQRGADANAAMDALKKQREETLAKLKALAIDINQAQADPPKVLEKKTSNAIQAQLAAARGARARKKKADDSDMQMQQVVRVPVPITSKDVSTIILETEPIKATV